MRKLLLGSVVAVALLTGCGDNKKESKQTSEIKKEEVVANNQTQTPAVEKENIQKIEEPKETTTTVVNSKEKVIIAPDKVESEGVRNGQYIIIVPAGTGPTGQNAQANRPAIEFHIQQEPDSLH